MEPLPVIIVSYKTEQLLRQCLTSLKQSVGATLRIIVVDNNSADGTVEMLRRQFPDVCVLPQSENVGFAKANNIALRALGFSDTGLASGTTPASPYVLLLNPDTEVKPDAIRTLIAFLAKHKSTAVVGPQLMYPDGRFQQSSFRFPGILQIVFDFYPLHHRLLNSRLNGRYPRRTGSYQVGHPLGACLLARASAIQQVGLMDEGYFMYVEEIDWCRRMSTGGWQIWTEPRAIVVHHEGQSTRQFREAMYVQLWRSRLRYYQKFHSVAYVALARAAVHWGLRSERRRISADSSLTVAERDRRMAAVLEVEAMWTPQ